MSMPQRSSSMSSDEYDPNYLSLEGAGSLSKQATEHNIRETDCRDYVMDSQESPFECDLSLDRNVPTPSSRASSQESLPTTPAASSHLSYSRCVAGSQDTTGTGLRGRREMDRALLSNQAGSLSGDWRNIGIIDLRLSIDRSCLPSQTWPKTSSGTSR
ncbi:hypothetical protein Aduo_016941 [Ancylostoma duodenale]